MKKTLLNLLFLFALFWGNCAREGAQKFEQRSSDKSIDIQWMSEDREAERAEVETQTPEPLTPQLKAARGLLRLVDASHNGLKATLNIAKPGLSLVLHSDASGYLSLAHLPPDDYWIFARSEHCASMLEFKFSWDPSQNVELQLQPFESATLVVVNADQQPLNRVWARIARDAVHLLAIHVHARSDGQLDLGPLAPGQYFVEVWSPGYLPFRGFRVLNPTTEPIVLKKPLSVQGYVRDAHGNAQNGYRVVGQVWTAKGAYWHWGEDRFYWPELRKDPITAPRAAISDAKGFFHFDDLPEFQTLELWIESQNLPRSQVYRFDAQALERSMPNLILWPEVHLLGRVQNPQGDGIPKVRIFGSMQPSGPWELLGLSDAQGYFDLSHLAEPWWIQWNAPSYQPYVQKLSKWLVKDPPILTLQPWYELSGDAVDAHFTPWPGIKIEYRAQDGTLYLAETNAQGHFSIKNLKEIPNGRIRALHAWIGKASWSSVQLQKISLNQYKLDRPLVLDHSIELSERCLRQWGLQVEAQGLGFRISQIQPQSLGYKHKLQIGDWIEDWSSDCRILIYMSKTKRKRISMH